MVTGSQVLLFCASGEDGYGKMVGVLHSHTVSINAEHALGKHLMVTFFFPPQRAHKGLWGTEMVCNPIFANSGPYPVCTDDGTIQNKKKLKSFQMPRGFQKPS